MPIIIASSTFNKRLVEKVQKYRSEYAESHWKVWSQIAAEMSQEDGKTYAHLHLSKHFRNKLIPHLDSYALDEELVNQLQYPYLRRVYHLQLCFYRGATQREDNVENITDNKLFIRYMTNGNTFDPEVLQLFKRRGSKASQMRKILINVSDPAYAVPDHIQVHLTAMKRLFRGKFLYNGQRWVAPHTKPTAVSRPCEGSLIALDGELVRIENCSAPSLLSSPCNLLEKESLVINTQEFEKMCHEHSQHPDFEKLSIDSAFAADLSDHGTTQPDKDPLTLSSFNNSNRSITPDRSPEQSAITIGSSPLSTDTFTNESALDDDGDNEDISSSSLPNGESFKAIGISNVEYEDTVQSINSSCNTTNENNLETESPNGVGLSFSPKAPGDHSILGAEEFDASVSPDEQKRTRLYNGHIPIRQEVVTNTIDPQVDVIVLDTSSDDENDEKNVATAHAKDSLSAAITPRNHGSVEENQRNSEHSSMNTTGETVVEKIPQYVDVTPVPLIVCPGLSLTFFTDPFEDDAAAWGEEESDASGSVEDLMVHDNTTPNSLTHERSNVSDASPVVEDQLEDDAVTLGEEDSDASDLSEELMISPRDDRFNETNLSLVVEDQSEPSTKRIRLDNGYISIKEELVTNTIDPQVDVIVLDTPSDEESDAENSATPHAKDSLSAVITARNHGSVEENQRNSEHSSMNTTGETVVEKIPPRVDVTPVPFIVCPVTGLSLKFFTDPFEDDAAALGEEDSDASGSAEELMVHDNTTPNSLTHERSNVPNANPVVEDQLEGDAMALGEEDSNASDLSEEQMVYDNTAPNSITHERSSNVFDANPVVEDQLEGDAMAFGEEESDASGSAEELMVHDNTTPNSLTHERSNVPNANPVVEDQLEGDAVAFGEEESDASDLSEEQMVHDNTTPNSLTHERSNVPNANPVVEDQLEGDAMASGEEESDASDLSEEQMVHDNTAPNSITHKRSSNVSDANPVVEDQLEGDAMAFGEEESDASGSAEELMVHDNTAPNSITHERFSNVSDAIPVVEDQSAELSAKPIELSTVANPIEQEEVAISTTDHEQEEGKLSGQSVVDTYFEGSSQINSAAIQPPEIVCDSSSPIESGAETGHNRENTLSDGGDTDSSPIITAAQPPMDQHKALPSEQIDHPVGIRIRNEVENTPMQDAVDEGGMVRSTTLVALVRSRLDENLLLDHETLLRPMIMSKRKLWEEMRKSLPHLFVKQPDEAAAHSMSLLICHKLCLIRLVSEGLKREYCISAKLETVMSIAAQLAYGTPDITKFLS